MSRRLWIIATIIILLGVNAYPIYQLFNTGGYLFYQNGPDEPTYLQYDFSRNTQSLTRSGQYIVTLAHEIGFSAGWINLIFDFVFLIAFVWVTKEIFQQIGFIPTQARLSSFLMTTLPLLFFSSNPLMRAFSDNNNARGLIYWVTMPVGNDFGLIRSPEPQISLIVFSLALLISLKQRTFLFAYLSLPFLYPFVTIPAAFVILAIHLKTMQPRLVKYPFALPLVSFITISCALLLYFNFVVDNGMKEMLVNSRYPLISLTGIISLLLYFSFSKQIKPEFRFLALVVAVTPLAVANHQLISGWVAMPKNFELYAGLYCIAIIVILVLPPRPPFQIGAGLLVFIALLSFAYRTFQYNDQLNRQLEFNDNLLAALKNDSSHVAINHPKLASYAGMIFPRQPLTTFAYEKTYRNVAAQYFPDYLCAKQEVLKTSRWAEEFESTLETLDEAYKYESRDFIMAHLGRKTSFQIVNDPNRTPTSCPPTHYFFAPITQTGRRIVGNLNVYTIPADLPLTEVEKLLKRPRSPFVIPSDAFLADIVQLKSDGLIVQGDAEGPFSFLMNIPNPPLAEGDFLIAQGKLANGGLRFGFRKDQAWLGQVEIVKSGEFTIIAQAPNQDSYALILANLLRGSEQENKFTITSVGLLTH